MADTPSSPRRPGQPMASGHRVGRPGSFRSSRDDETGTVQTQRVQRVSWPRRIGILAAVCALGGTVVFASGILGPHGTSHPSASPRGSQPIASGSGAPGSSHAPAGVPVVAPVVAAPSAPVTRAATWTATVSIPDLGISRRGVRLDVYRNGKQVMAVALPKGSSMTVKIALRRGQNKVVAAFAGPGGEGPRSTPVSITLDDIAPRITIGSPANGANVPGASVSLEGTSEAGATITVSNTSNQTKASATAAADGSFSVTVALAQGTNQLSIAAVDAVGNSAHATWSVVRSTTQAAVKLSLTQSTFRLRNLPQTFDVHLSVTDASGAAVDGAPVTFSFSPPGQPTSTYQATTSAGRASWLGVVLPKDGTTAGSGLVTAQVTLPDGSTAQVHVSFTVKQ